MAEYLKSTDGQLSMYLKHLSKLIRIICNIKLCDLFAIYSYSELKFNVLVIEIRLGQEYPGQKFNQLIDLRLINDNGIIKTMCYIIYELCVRFMLCVI